MHNLVPIRVFDEVATQTVEESDEYWVQAWRYGEWDHPSYGKVEITPDIAQEFRDHFVNNTYGQELQANYDHGADAAKGNKAAGWIKDMELRDDGVFYKVKFTETALDEINKGEWKYLSPEYDDWTNPETKETFQNVPMGIALTNRPFFKNMAPLNFSEMYVELEVEEEKPKDFADWSTAYKNNLPDSAFMYIEQGGTKDSEGKTTPRSKRHFPFKGSDGKVDSIHLEKVIQLVGKANLPEGVKAAVAAKARRMSGNPKENTEVNEELRKFAERLGIKITDDSTDESVLTEAFSVIEPLMEVKKEGEQLKTFREAYPTEYEEMQSLKALRVETDAKKFAEQFSRFATVTKNEAGEEVIVNSDKGYSALVLHAIEDTHKKFSEGNASAEDLKELLSTMASDDAVVTYGEAGSAREKEADDRDTSKRPAMQFADVVKELMKSDNLEYGPAVKLAMEKEPQLAAAYLGDKREVK